MNKEIEISLSNDSMFKLVFGSNENKKFTAWLFNNVQDEIKINPEDIIFESPDNKSGKTFNGEMDVSFQVNKFLYVDFEIQMYMPTDYGLLERLDTYLSNLKISSLQKGDNYRKRKTFVICFLNSKLFKDNNEYKLMKRTLIGNDEVLKDHNIIIYQLPNYKNCGNIMVRNIMELLVTKNPSTYKGRDETMDEIIDLLLDKNQDSLYVFRKLKEQQNEIFRKWDEEEAKERAFSEGVDVGVEKERRVIALKMKENGVSVELISVSTGLTKEEIESL